MSIVVDPLTLNRYNYVNSSPLNYIDPSGHKTQGNSSTETKVVPFDIAKDASDFATKTFVDITTNTVTNMLMGSKKSGLAAEMERAAKKCLSGTCELTKTSIVKFFKEINWQLVMQGLGIAIMGTVVMLIGGTILAGIAPLVLPALLLLAQGTLVLACLIALGTAAAAVIAVMFWLSDIVEGATTTVNGALGKDETGVNVVRDTLFAKDPDAYYLIEFMATGGATKGAEVVYGMGMDQQILMNYDAYTSTTQGKAIIQSGVSLREITTRGTGNVTSKNIRFSQDSISSKFSDGSTVDDMINGLKSGQIKPNDVPAIRIFEKNGVIYSLDNRRLYAFQQAGIDNIPYKWATPQEIANEAWKFTTTNGGTSIRVRGQ